MSYEPTSRTTLRRIPDRGRYDRATVHAILDEALVCHLGFVDNGQPLVIPTIFVRDGESLFFHGAAASRTLRAVSGGLPVSLTVSLIDGIVLARSAFHHSMNYRSVVVLGQAHEVTDREQKLRALLAFVEKMSPGRATDARPPTEKEMNATKVLRLPLIEVSAKVREGGPKDDAEDLDRPIWAGHYPVRLSVGDPIRDGHAVGDAAAPRLSLHR